MKVHAKDYILDYLEKVKKANKELTKKELFKDLLNRLYSGSDEIIEIIDKISLGAEAAIINIPRKDRLHRGSADTLYNKIIIEFENDLSTSFSHAKQQLAGYLLGMFNTGEGYNYTLIVSDFIHWKILAPDITQLDSLEKLTETELILNEAKDSSFDLNEDNYEDFYYWLDRFLFKEEKQKATLNRIEEAFSFRSTTFIECFRNIFSVFQDAKKFGEVQVSYEQWRKFLSIAYGSFNDSDESFVIHSYLSVLAKILAFEVLSNNDFIEDSEMKEILNGNIFHKYNIGNFVENDFFHWVYNDRNFPNLKKSFRLISQELSHYDFTNVDEDVLKGVYQDLIDLDTRHSLGEYYTPDWLCERMVQEFNFRTFDKVLDPSCGSGSFLRAVIHRFIELHPELSVEQIIGNVYGIDIHPLSVQIAKTTVLISLGSRLLNSKKRIKINVILANTLLAPDGVKDLFGKNFKMNIDKDTLLINSQILLDLTLFDDGLDVCDEFAEETFNTNKVSPLIFENRLQQRHKNGGLNQEIIKSFYKIYESLKSVKERGRDSIWKFIMQNLYKPYFLADKFDYIIGNPPWFTYSSIKNEEYQNILNELAEKNLVKPDRVANFPHLEIAAIFLSYCAGYFLKEGGKLAFVLPRSFISADHHENTRNGKAKGFRLTNIWDFDKVSNLFNIPNCVFFAEKSMNNGKIPATGIQGRIFKGKIKFHNAKWKDVKNVIKEEETVWYYITQGKSSAFSNKKTKPSKKVNPYKKLFKQGATIVPRTFYFVQVDMAYKAGWEKDFDWSDRTINLKTSKSILQDAKLPWKKFTIKGLMESRFIFRTALSKSILPFALYKPDLVVLPIMINDDDEGRKTIEVKSADEISYFGYGYARKWFKQSERYWSQLCTEKNRNFSSHYYLDWQNKLKNQNLNAPYLVIYNASAKDANATIIKREDLDLEFIVESKAYVYYTPDMNEAYYLTAILNSSIPNKLIKAFQTKGLFGPRDIHKKILNIYFPKFNTDNIIHIQLAELGKKAHEKAKQFLINNPPTEVLSANRLGRIRLNIKKHLEDVLNQIDMLVEKIIS
ncbi:MAG: putative Endonuclease [Ignavibacteria bacterium]|nr:putative Endonuclease [Ignavibacteria bacterium]